MNRPKHRTENFATERKRLQKRICNFQDEIISAVEPEKRQQLCGQIEMTREELDKLIVDQAMYALNESTERIAVGQSVR